MRHLDPPARRSEPDAPAIILIVATMLMATAPLTARAARPVAKEVAHAHTVAIEGMRFNPRTLRVRRGDRITWINKDPFPHTVTATGGKFDSHPIAAGASWTYVARQPGNYDYGCTLHVDMKGTLLVR